MEQSERIEIGGGASVILPAGWIVEADTEGGSDLFAEDGVGLLHLVSFEQDPDELLDPAEELYTFLEDQGIELEDDDVEDVALGGEAAMLALCEYMTEADEESTTSDKDEEEATFWMTGVATAPGALLFGSYSCPAGEQAAERDAVREILASLRLAGGV